MGIGVLITGSNVFCNQEFNSPRKTVDGGGIFYHEGHEETRRGRKWDISETLKGIILVIPDMTSG